MTPKWLTMLLAWMRKLFCCMFLVNSLLSHLRNSVWKCHFLRFSWPGCRCRSEHGVSGAGTDSTHHIWSSSDQLQPMNNLYPVYTMKLARRADELDERFTMKPASWMLHECFMKLVELASSCKRGITRKHLSCSICIIIKAEAIEDVLLFSISAQRR